MIQKIICTFLLLPALALAQFTSVGADADEDVQIGGDIFSDFNEDLEASQVMEDERFYRYGRFFTVNVGLGHTTFTGNRGSAFPDRQQNGPSWQISFMYFSNFQTAFLMGLGYSQHTAFIDTFVRGSPTERVGTVKTSLLRPYVGLRHYIDTSDLGTAITYSNPYITGTIEYWYQTNEYPDSKNFSDDAGGGLGTGIGFGLEFPMQLKESYFNIEFLYHFVNFYDKFTPDFQQISDEDNDDPAQFPSEYGYNDLSGDVITLMFTYNINW